MQISYQHANVTRGNESTLLRFTAADGRRACVLVDAGDGVDVEAMLDEDEYLTAILLTHAHIDHYRSLARNVVHGASVYAAPATAAVLERALPEARKDSNVGPVEDALDALEPIADWTDVLPEVAVRPVPAGHAPGATGFAVRVTDDAGAIASEHHLLVTGDFSRRPCGGFPGFPTAYPFEVDALLCNVATNDSYESTLRTAVRTVLERAFAGSRVVLAGGSLSGVHLATVLGAVADRLGRTLRIRVVGQTAKLLEALRDEVPGDRWELDALLADGRLEPWPVFDDPAEVLEPGTVTVAGPASPTRGSAERLFDAIAADSGALFVQTAGGDPPDAPRGGCTTRTFDLGNHPTRETVLSVVEALVPQQVIVKHAGRSTMKRFQRDLDHCFVWGSGDEAVHRLYADGEWLEPPWISEAAVRSIRSGRRERLQEPGVERAESLPPLDPGPVDLAAEGLDLDSLAAAFAGPIADPYGGAAGSGAASSDAPGSSPLPIRYDGGDGETDAVDSGDGFVPDGDPDGGHAPERRSDAETAGRADVAAWLSAETESSFVTVGDGGIPLSVGTSRAGPGESAEGADALPTEPLSIEVLDRLESIERRLDGERLPARVLGGGPDRVLKPLEDVELEPGEILTVRIQRDRETGTDPSVE
ncbi:MBL fold metallo-hydrolase [Halovivax limisalsi]|uniref:MBL fold metallo-hydrolase n=1 Tax=Halovivax limisalsi TaxID=1453760 RepID=UPI001FFC6AF8|nr:MBL fold metallo-hydrolase [Halovivax limisalsi]